MVILGHSNISVTLGIYTHVDEDSRRDALDRLDQALRVPARDTALSPADTPLLSLLLSHSLIPVFGRIRDDADLVGLRGLEPRTSSLSGIIGRGCHLVDRRSGVGSCVPD
jgi:hypothetical protein